MNISKLFLYYSLIVLACVIISFTMVSVVSLDLSWILDIPMEWIKTFIVIFFTTFILLVIAYKISDDGN